MPETTLELTTQITYVLKGGEPKDVVDVTTDAKRAALASLIKEALNADAVNVSRAKCLYRRKSDMIAATYDPVKSAERYSKRIRQRRIAQMEVAFVAIALALGAVMLFVSGYVLGTHIALGG